MSQSNDEHLIGAAVVYRVASELARQLSRTTEPVGLYHYRDRDGYEVDALLEQASGDVVPRSLGAIT